MKLRKFKLRKLKLEDMPEPGVDPIDEWPYNIVIDGVEYATTFPIDARIASKLLERFKSKPMWIEGETPYCIRLTEYEDGVLHMRTFAQGVMTMTNAQTGQKMETPTAMESNQYFNKDELFT